MQIYRICLASHLHERWITLRAINEAAARAIAAPRKRGWHVKSVTEWKQNKGI